MVGGLLIIGYLVSQINNELQADQALEQIHLVSIGLRLLDFL